MKTNKKLLSVDIAEIALFVALMVAGAYISIPFYPVALTFQTVFAILAGLLLGWKKGTIAVAVYFFMGFVCFIPVFANHSVAGFAYALNPSFGYIIGFIAAAFVGGMIVRGENVPFWRYIVGSLAAFLVNYIIGIPYFALIWKFYLNSSVALSEAIVLYNLIYMPKDAVLSVLAAVLAWRVVPIIRKGKKKLAEPKENVAEENTAEE